MRACTPSAPHPCSNDEIPADHCTTPAQRNTGTWTPYSTEENRAIEAAFNSGAASLEVPTCFNAVVHFSRDGGHHHQMTPAVGTKPAGFRSVLRGEAGQSAALYWWEDSRLWRLETPDFISYTQDVLVSAPQTAELSFTWQWCDLTGAAAGDAREVNWHPYAPDHGAEVEDAWSRGVTKEITVGLTNYRIGGWQGSYGTQENLSTGVVRQVRRGRFTVLTSTPSDYVDESCALCTERFTDTPEWPIRRTPCNHAFHWTCLQHILRQRSGAPKCPMCRRSLQGMSQYDTTGNVCNGHTASSAASTASASAVQANVHPMNWQPSPTQPSSVSAIDPRELYGWGGYH